MKKAMAVLAAAFLLTLPSCKKKEAVMKEATAKPAETITHIDGATVEKNLAQLSPVPIDYDHKLLSEKETRVLKLLVKASIQMDKIFLRQVDPNNPALRAELEKRKDPPFPLLTSYFDLNFGPYDRLDHHKPFINLSRTKPLGAGFYPEDLTKEEWEAFLKAHPEQEEAFTSSFTVITRTPQGLTAVPYSHFYKGELEPAAALLKEAASLTENASLKKYLNSRAEAFLSNDYYQSDMDWMDLKDHRIEVVIGPYEVYEDNLFSYKASYESFVTLVDPAESEKMAAVTKYLDAMEKNLPMEEKYKNFSRGKSSPILVVQEVFTAGDTKAGVQTTAFNLPNDERVRQAKGSKKVMLKNIAKAKYDTCWVPIVKEVLAEKDLPLVSFDAYFNHVLLHEVSHGLGPGILKIGNKTSTVSKELKETYPTIEEAKADILGAWNTLFLIDKGLFPKTMEKQLAASFLGGIFRSVRFGLGEAHGGANAIILNYLQEKGAFLWDEKAGRFGVDYARFRPALKELAKTLLTIEATGDYPGAKGLINKYNYASEALKTALDKVKNVPVDIRPLYSIEKEI